MEAHLQPQHSPQSSPEEDVGGEYGVCSRSPQEGGGCGRCTAHYREEQKLPTHTEMKVASKICQRMQIPPAPVAIERCPSGDPQPEVAAREGQGCVLSQALDPLQVPLHHVKQMTLRAGAQGGIATNEACDVTLPKSPPVEAQQLAGLHAQPRENGNSLSRLNAAGLHSSRIQSNSLSRSRCVFGTKLTAAEPGGSPSERATKGQGSTWTMNRTGEAHSALQNTVMLIGGSIWPDESPRGKVGEVKQRCEPSHAVASKLVPPVDRRSNQIGGVRALHLSSAQNGQTLLENTVTNVLMSVESPVSAAVARGRLPPNVPSALRLQSICGSRVTRSQTAAAALAEVVRIDDSSDEEEGPVDTGEHGVHAPAVEAPERGQPTIEAADGRNFLDSSSGPSCGMMGGKTKAATAFLILLAALVLEDGHSCVLSAESVSSAAAECPILQLHQQYRSSSEGASVPMDEANGERVHRLEEGNCTAKGVLVLQADREEGGVSLDLWQPPPESAIAAPTALQNVSLEAPLGTQVESPSSNSLVSLLCFPKSLISHFRWLGLGTAAALPGVVNSELSEEVGTTRDRTCCNKPMCCCCCHGSSTDRRSRHAKDKDRKHSRTHTTKARAKPAEGQAEVGPEGRSGQLNLRALTVSHSGETSVPTTSGSFALNDLVTAAPCSPSADATQPTNVLPREAAPTAKSDAASVGEYERLNTTKKKSSTRTGASHNNSKEPEPAREALGKRSSGGHDRRQSNSSSKNKLSSSIQSRTHQNCKRERKERPFREEGSLEHGNDTKGDSSPHRPTGVHSVKKEQIHGISTPRNALTVTDGKPLHGIPLSKSGMTSSILWASIRCEDKSDDIGKKSKRDGSNNGYSTCGSVKDQDVERQQHLSDESSRFGDILALERSGRKEKQLKEEEAAREHRSSKQLVPEDAFIYDSTVYHGDHLSSSKCRRASGSHVSSQGRHAVPVLCLELHQSQAGKLHCSDLLQKVLEQESKNSVCCASPHLQEGQPRRGYSEGAVPKTTAFADTRQPTAHIKSSRHGSSNTKSETGSKRCKSRRSSDSSSSTISASISGTSFRDSSSANSNSNSNSKMADDHCHVPKGLSTEGGCEVNERHHYPSTSKRSSRTRSSTSKHEDSSNSRRRCRSSSSRRKKLRREVSPHTNVATAATDCRKELFHSPVREPVPQRDVRGDGTSGCSSAQLTQELPRNVSSSSGDSTESGCHQRLHFCGGSSPEIADPAPILELSMAGQKSALSVNATGKSSSITPIGNPKKRGPWLLLCIGPALHVAPPGENATIARLEKQSGSKLVEAESVVQSVCHSAPSDQRGSSSETKLRLWEAEVPAGCRNDFASLFEVLLPSNLVAEEFIDRLRGTGAAGEPTDVADLAAFFTSCITEHKKIYSGNQENIGQHVPEVVSHVSRVLHQFLARSIGPWKAMRKSRSSVSSFSIERLANCWRARPHQAAVDSSLTSGSEALRSLPLDPASALSRPVRSKTDIRGQASARSAGAAPPPVFDLLLDDRTLRRLSEKEFLDDTIIDFCLGFIVDHILTPEERLRVHISNTFFLSALMEQRCEMEAHTRLTRWLKKELTPLPKKDFIFIPVHHKHQHWSLAVVVYPWRALNPSQANNEGSTGQTASENSACKSDANKPLEGIQQHYPLGVPAHRAGIKGFPSIPTIERVAPFLIGKCRGVDLGQAPAPLKASGQHAQKPSRQKARLFHVDSMGLRSVFDRCRGRLKRFLRHEFEHRCGSELKSGEKVELCTDSCCWHDGHSCTLHTPRQQNGYDCGVFVVEYVYFLTRNLNAIETLLVGPSRDCQPQHRNNQQPPAPSIAPSVYGCLGRVDTSVENRNQGKLLEAALGFHCPCMEAAFPAQMPAGAGSAFGLSYNLKARLAELRQAHAALLGSSNTVFSRQRDLQLQVGVPPTPSNVSQGEAVQVLTPEPMEKINHPVRPHEERIHRRQELTEAIRLPDKHYTDGGVASKQQCPMWGPLPLCISKRRSSHTKWFSQGRVTERRSQLHKMLLFMRQNIRWREDPKLIAHLKSLFLNIGSL